MKILINKERWKLVSRWEIRKRKIKKRHLLRFP